MADILLDLIARLKDAELPVLHGHPDAVLNIVDGVGDNRDLTRIVRRDPGLCLRLLRHFSNTRDTDPPKTMLALLGLLGMGTVADSIGKAPVIDPKNPRHQGLRQCYARALHTAATVRVIADLRREDYFEDLQTAALFVELAPMALWVKSPASMTHIEKRIAEEGMSQNEAALQVIGVTLDDLGAGLAREWKLPELVIHAQHLHNSYLPRPLMVLLAHALAREALRDWHSPATLEWMDMIAEYCAAPLEKVATELHQAATSLAQYLHGTGLPHSMEPLIRAVPARLLKPREAPNVRRAAPKKPDEATSTVSRVAPKPDSGLDHGRPSARTKNAADSSETPTAPDKGSISRDHQAATDASPDRDRSSDARSQDSPVSSTLQRSEASPETQTSAITEEARALLHTRLLETLKLICQETGAKRALLATLTKDRKTLKTRLIIDQDPESSLKTLSCDATSKHLFTLLLARQQALWVNPSNLLRYVQFLPEDAAPLLCPDGFFVMSILVQHKPLGFIYADAFNSEHKLHREGYERFMHLCDEARKLFINGDGT